MRVDAFLQGARRYGWFPYTVSRFFRFLQSLGLHVWVVHLRLLDLDFEIPPEHAEHYTFRRLTYEDALAQSQSNPELDLPQDFLEDAFARGDILVGGFEGNNLVAYTWRSLDSAPIKGDLWLKLIQPGCRYAYKALVLHDYRGQRLNETVRSFYDRDMAAMGIKQNIGYIDRHNLASLRAHRNLNQEKIGLAGYFRRGNLWITFRSREVRKFLELVRK